MTTRDSSYWTPERLAAVTDHLPPASQPEPKRKTRTTRDRADRLPSGRWRGRYTDEQGGTHTKTFDTHAEAVAWAEDQRASVRRGRHVAPRDARTTFKTFSQEWLAGHGGVQSTVDGHEIRLRVHCWPTWGDVALGDVRASTVNAWLRSLSHLAPSTRKGVFTTFNAVLSAAVDDDMLAVNPCSKRSVSKPKAESKTIEPWTHEMVEAFREALPEQYRVLVTIGAGLGLRQGEVFGLSPTDVDWFRGKITVQRQVKVAPGNRLIFAPPKYGKTRTVPLPDSVRDVLSAHLAARPAVEVALPWEVVGGRTVTVPLIVTSREGKPMNKNYVNTRLWKPALASVGIPTTRDNGSHALRHYYVSVLVDAGESIKAIASYLGHEDPGFTLRVYGGLMPTSHERTRNAIDAAFARAKSASTVTHLSREGSAGG